jgi:amino acid transporter
MLPALLTYINFVSVKLFLRVQNVFTVSKLLACLIIVMAGIYEICAGEFPVHTWCGGAGTGVAHTSLILQKIQRTGEVKHLSSTGTQRAHT